MGTNKRGTAAGAISRRQMLRMLGAGSAGILLASCGAAPAAPTGAAPTAAPAAAATAAPAAEPTTAAQGAEAAAAPGTYDKWKIGTVDPNISGDFRALSWEGEGEMRKWLLHINSYLKAEYPKVTAQITWGVPWDEYWTKLPTSISGGDAPDLAWMHDTRVQSFASRNLLQPLDDYISRNPPDGWPKEFYDSQVKSFNYNGKQYAIPYDWAPGGLYVNKDMLEKAGLSMPTENSSLDDLVQMAKTLSRPQDKVFGLGMPYDWPAGLYWVFRSFGAEFFDKDLTKGLLDTPESIAAVQWLVDLRFKHNASPRPESIQGVDNPFSQGLVAMNWTLNDEAFVVSELIGTKFKWDVAPSPKGPAGRFQFVGGSGWSIPKGSKQPDLAYELTRFTLSNPAILPTTGRMGSMFVSRADMWENAMPTPGMHFSAESFKHAFYDLGKKDGVVPPYHPHYVEWEALWKQHMEPLFIGEQKDVASTMKAFNADTTKLLTQPKS